MPCTIVATIYSGLLVHGWNDKDWHRVLAIDGGNLKVQQIVLQGKFLLPGGVEAFLIVGGHSS